MLQLLSGKQYVANKEQAWSRIFTACTPTAFLLVAETLFEYQRLGLISRSSNRLKATRRKHIETATKHSWQDPNEETELRKGTERNEKDLQLNYTKHDVKIATQSCSIPFFCVGKNRSLRWSPFLRNVAASWNKFAWQTAIEGTIWTRLRINVVLLTLPSQHWPYKSHSSTAEEPNPSRQMLDISHSQHHFAKRQWNGSFEHLRDQFEWVTIQAIRKYEFLFWNVKHLELLEKLVS